MRSWSVSHPDHFCALLSFILFFVEPPVMILWLDDGCRSSASAVAARGQEQDKNKQPKVDPFHSNSQAWSCGSNIRDTAHTGSGKA